ncbi:hypothetical protein [Acetonema longum]|nr:hypothetical protein [Acetonema longum]
MYRVECLPNGKYGIYQLEDIRSQAKVRVAPERGGMIYGFEHNGTDVLYLNAKTFLDPSSNVRGGIPILFPICGQLENGRYTWQYQTYSMKNHGFARDQVWKVIESNTEGQAVLALELTSNDQTRQVFPFDFSVIFTYILQGSSLTIRQTYENRSASDMPLYAGLHPYFNTSSKNLPLATDATQYLDCADQQIKPFLGSIDLSDSSDSILLLDSRSNCITFDIDHQYKVILEQGQEFKYIVFWSEPGKDFICVEPWMGKANELNLKQELLMVKPGERVETYCKISVLPLKGPDQGRGKTQI